jgi:hypothetical protein
MAAPSISPTSTAKLGTRDNIGGSGRSSGRFHEGDEIEMSNAPLEATIDILREHGINPTVRQGGKHLKVEFDLDGKRPRGGCGEGGAQLVVSDQSYLQGMAGRAGRHVEKAEENEMNESKRLCVYTHSANGQIFLCNQKQSEENEHEKVIACCNNPFVLRRAEHGKIA